MKISILTPTYNHVQYLAEAIESVRRQDIDVAVQHVVTDGGSKDGTAELLGAFGSDVVWLSEPDSGQSDALNRALALADGDIIGWLNADEFYLPGALQRVADEFRRDPKVDVISADSILADDGGRALRLYSGHRMSRAALRGYDCYILTSSLFVRRSALSQFQWDVRLRVTMDWDLLLFLLGRQATFRYVPETISVFRVYPEQASARLTELRAGETTLLAERHHVPLGPGHGLSRLVGRTAHMLWKLFDGAYAREVRFAKKHRRLDTRWCHGHGSKHE